MMVCLSIAPGSTTEALSLLKEVDSSVDLVELRIDGITDMDLASLLRKPRPKMIITNRRAGEGGKFTGSAEVQLETLSAAASLGAEYVDIEMSWGENTVHQLVSSVHESAVIVSYHNFAETPGNLPLIFQAMRSTGAGIIKIATLATSIDDNVRMFRLCESAIGDGQPIIALCMDERGEISRILGGKYGSFLTFGARTSSESTAPGQRTIDDLNKVFRIHTLTSRTKVFGLVGNPVSRSRGIYYHNRVFARKSLDAVYVNFLVDDLAKFFMTFREMISGASITMPFKQEIIPLLNTLSPEAASLRAVNTIIRRNGELHGYNTDLPAISSLLSKSVDPKNKEVIVLGTGGTARTMAFAAIALGARTTIVGRSSYNASALANELGCSSVTFEHLPELQCDVLMNGTSVGMGSVNAQEREERIVPPEFLRKSMLVFDAVYDPPLTPLLQDAEATGCQTISGVELFKRQAQIQSKLFLESTT